jgi:TonB family protein
VRTVVALLLLGVVGQQPTVPRLNSLSAQEHIGEVARVCGHATSYGCSRPDGLWFNFATNNSSRFRFRVPYAELGKFDNNLEGQYLDRLVCATGLIEKRERLTEVVISEPAAIEILPDRPGLPAFAPGAHRSCEPDVELPKVIKDTKPSYTARAIGERVQGTVLLEAVIESTGAVGATRVIRSLHRDLDAEAIIAARKWKFQPGTFRGQAAPVVVTIEMTFTLGK